MSKAIKYDSVAEIVRHYGGPRPFAERINQKIGNVNSFLQRKGFPPRYYLQHAAILSADNIEASPSLWGQIGTENEVTE